MRVALLVLAFSALIACESELTPTPTVAHEGTGLSEGEPRGGDARPEAAEVAAVSVPFEGDLSARPEGLTLVMSRIIFVPEEIPLQVVDGFNLDGLESDGSSEAGCYLADLRSPDGEPGIDNHFASILPALRSTQVGAVDPDTELDRRGDPSALL